MKNKFIAVFALVLCMSVFLMPVSAYAAADSTPPTVMANITGNALKIEAKDADSGVEAVFIDDKRFNYRVDSVIEVDAREYVGDSETVEIYAVDFAGNKSEVITIDNPYFVEPIETPTETPEPTEIPQTQENPFTPSGQASVVDQASESDGKDFYSFTTPAGNVFYLIIDHQRNAENVYFLNAVTEDDLLALAEKSDKGSNGAIPTTQPTPTEKPTETETPTETEPPAKESGNSGMIIFVVLALAAAGGAGYYFKILKPKQAANAEPDDYEDDGEEMEFEDEPEDDSDYDSEPDSGTDDEE